MKHLLGPLAERNLIFGDPYFSRVSFFFGKYQFLFFYVLNSVHLAQLAQYSYLLTPKLALLKVGPSLVYFPQDRQKAQRTCDSISISFMLAQKNV